MSDRNSALDALDHLEAPDLWPAVVRRSPGPPEPVGPRPSRRVAAAVLAIIVAGAGIAFVVRAFRSPSSQPAASSTLTTCAQIIPGCRAKRLPDVVLTDGQTSGALGPVNGMNLTGVVSFDDALRRAGAETQWPDAKTVQVTLGSANAGTLHWGQGTNLYYAIVWTGVCVPMHGPQSAAPGAPRPPCVGSDWGTVIDAHTGKFVVGGASQVLASGGIVVPDLLGLDGSNAQHVISQLGLSSDLSVATGSYTQGGVVQQRPRAGSIVEPGATIHLVIGPTPSSFGHVRPRLAWKRFRQTWAFARRVRAGCRPWPRWSWGRASRGLQAGTGGRLSPSTSHTFDSSFGSFLE
jgi:hypothetical protein